MGDAEQLALHLALAISHDSGERLAKFFDDLAGIKPGGRGHGGKSRAWRRREQVQAERLHACASHFGGKFSVIDQGFSSGRQIPVSHLTNKVECRAESRKE